MNSVFHVNSEDIMQYTPQQCTNIFNILLHLDARNLKIPNTDITISSNENVADGGIDAMVMNDHNLRGDLIKNTKMYYQLKSGKFSPWQKSVIQKELFGDNKKNAKVKIENLGSQIKNCVNNNGMYVLVCMKTDLNPKQKTDAEEIIKYFFQKLKIKTIKIEVWGMNHILSCINKFPSLGVEIKDNQNIRSHTQWGYDQEMQNKYQTGDTQEKYIENIRTILYDNTTSDHINIQGEAGIGKTRLIFESTRDITLSPLVVYCKSPEQYYDNFERECIKSNLLNLILVIDECDSTERRQIWNTLKNVNSIIKLITIHNQFIKADVNTKQIEIKKLDDAQIKKIIEERHMDLNIINQLTSICEGNPRFAHIIIWDLENNPGELLSTGTDISDILERYIRYGDKKDSQDADQRRIILLTVSLFTKFRYNLQYFEDETIAIQKLIRILDSSMTDATISRHIKILKDRKLLQGEHTLYISPKALHLWLWKTWWNEFDGINLNKFMVQMSKELLSNFIGMLEYSKHHPATARLIKNLFSDEGLLHDSEHLKNELGALFFRYLSSVDPNIAISHLEKTMGTWNSTDLKKFVTGRRDMIYALENIIFESKLFMRGGRMLRLLAENENEPWSNNATGTFSEIFSLHIKHDAPTKAPPSERIILLKETLSDKSKLVRDLGLNACSVALEPVVSAKVINAVDELELKDEGWTPQTYGELQDAHETIIDLLYSNIGSFPKEQQVRAAEIILKSFRNLLSYFPNMIDYIINMFEKLRKYIDDDLILETIITIYAYGNKTITIDTINKLKTLEMNMLNTDYSSMMKRYVKMSLSVDLLIGNYEKIREKKIKYLAKESLNIKKLQNELNWLVTNKATSGKLFGYMLSELDTSSKLLPTLLIAQKKSDRDQSGFFFSGYLQKIFERNESQWFQIMSDMSKDDKLLPIYLELIHGSGINDKIGLLIVDLLKNKKLDMSDLQIFSMGKIIKKLSKSIIEKWIMIMLKNGKPDIIFTALLLYYSYFIRDKNKLLNSQLAIKILNHNVFFDNKISISPMINHYWHETAKIITEKYPEKSINIARNILKHMASNNRMNNPYPKIILNNICSKIPNEIWDLMIIYLNVPLNHNGLNILNWLRSDPTSMECFFDIVDHERIFKWVDQDPKTRSRLLSRYVKPKLQKNNCLAREMLMKYGNYNGVYEALYSNFSTVSVEGNLSAYYFKMRSLLLTYKNTERNSNVVDWIERYVKILDKDIEINKIEEEGYV